MARLELLARTPAQAGARHPLRLSSFVRFTAGCVGSGLWATGGLWLLLHHFLQRETEFGLRPHPLEFWVRCSHGLFAFAALWTLGVLWEAHIRRALNSRRRLASGGFLMALLAWLGGSGYLLYYLGNERLLACMALLHWSAGITLPLFCVVHWMAVLAESGVKSGCRRAAGPGPG